MYFFLKSNHRLLRCPDTFLYDFAPQRSTSLSGFFVFCKIIHTVFDITNTLICQILMHMAECDKLFAGIHLPGTKFFHTVIHMVMVCQNIWIIKNTHSCLLQTIPKFNIFKTAFVKPCMKKIILAVQQFRRNTNIRRIKMPEVHRLVGWKRNKSKLLTSYFRNMPHKVIHRYLWMPVNPSKRCYIIPIF